MARKIATGDAEIEQCISLLSSECQGSVEKIKKMLEEGIEHSTKGMVLVENKEVEYIYTCSSESGRVVAETRLTSGLEGAMNLKYGFLDPIVMCWILNESGIFKDVKCSSKLGVARVNINDKIIMIFQDGRINVRNARDKHDAIEAIKFVSRILWGSIICSRCGNAGMDCASGGCEDCLNKVWICPVIEGGPPGPFTSNQHLINKKTSLAIFKWAKKLETGKYFFEGIRFLDRVVNLLTELAEKIVKGQFEKTLINEMENEMNKTNKLAVRFIIETHRIQDATIGLILAGITLDLFRVTAGLKTIIENQKPMNNEIKGVFTDAIEIVVQAYSAFRKFNFEVAKQAIDKYLIFREKWGQLFNEQPASRGTLVPIIKIASNGFYIARLLTKSALT
jgi:hypothetical protein